MILEFDPFYFRSYFTIESSAGFWEVGKGAEVAETAKVEEVAK